MTISDKNRYRQISAALLAVLFLSFWTLKISHVLLAHHTHEAHPECEIAVEHAGATHLHGEEFGADDCSLCDMAFASADLPPGLVFPSVRVVAPIATPIAVIQAPFVANKGAFFHRRGPPVVSLLF
jgi:Protein of unknown function (DUF2946)